MANKRSQNWLNQQRVDVPHLRSIESAVREDFDVLLSSFAMGEDQSYVLRGMEINMVGAIGSAASSLQLIVENSAILHGKSNVAGTFFQIDDGTPNETINSTTNTRVDGSFTPSALNYVGIEYNREIDNDTVSQLFFWNPTNKTEFNKNTPLAQTLDYQIVVSPTVWDSNVMPLAIVETDSANAVISVEDRRPMLFRLGTAGDASPDPFYEYPWDNHAEGRVENPFASSSATSPFRGGDKQILHFKEWADAVMSQIKELKGTTYWYSFNQGGSILTLRGDIANTILTGAGSVTHDSSTPGQLNWDEDFFLTFISSRLKYKIEANDTPSTDLTLSDNEVAYINIVRGQAITPSLVFTNGSATVNSVGSVAWTADILAGDYIKVAAEDDTKYYQVLSVDSLSEVTLTEPFQGSSTGVTGTLAQYAYGFYQVVGSPSTNRHVQVASREDVPFDEDAYWLFLRDDNGGSVAKVYMRGMSGEIEQGEERQISDNQTLQVLSYMGALSEDDSTPDYLNALTTSTAESRTATFPAASALTSGESFELYGPLDFNEYYVWQNIDGAGGNPNIPGKTGIEVALAGTDSNFQVAAKNAAAIDAIADFDATDNLDGTVTIANADFGVCTDSTNIDMGAGFSIVTDTQGTGAPNYIVIDGENLTQSIKRLDTVYGEIANSLDQVPYDETITVVAGAPADDSEITGPVAANTTITIPLNSRNSEVQEEYVVGDADLNVFLNGVLLNVGSDYTEVGTTGDFSTEVEMSFELLVDDVLKFEKVQGSGAGSGGGGGSADGLNLGSSSDANVYKQTVASQLQFRRLTAGANINITENANDIVIAATSGANPKNTNTIVGTNYSVLSSDNVILVENNGSNVTLTLPDANSVEGVVFDIKKIDAGNTLSIASISNQTLDGVDITATPHTITIQNESVSIVAVGGSFYFI